METSLSQAISMLESGWRPLPPPRTQLERVSRGGENLPSVISSSFMYSDSSPSIRFDYFDSEREFDELFKKGENKPLEAYAGSEGMLRAQQSLFVRSRLSLDGDSPSSCDARVWQWRLGDTATDSVLAGEVEGGLPSTPGNLSWRYAGGRGISNCHFLLKGSLDIALVRISRSDLPRWYLLVLNPVIDADLEAKLADQMTALQFAAGTRLRIRFLTDMKPRQPSRFWLGGPFGDGAPLRVADPTAGPDGVVAAYESVYQALTKRPEGDVKFLRTYIRHFLAQLEGGAVGDREYLHNLILQFGCDLIERSSEKPDRYTQLVAEGERARALLATAHPPFAPDFSDLLKTVTSHISWVEDILTSHDIRIDSSTKTELDRNPKEEYMSDPSSGGAHGYPIAMARLRAVFGSLLLAECQYDGPIPDPGLAYGGSGPGWRSGTSSLISATVVGDVERRFDLGWPDLRGAHLPENSILSKLKSEAEQIRISSGDRVAANLHPLSVESSEVVMLRAFLVEDPRIQTDLLRVEFGSREEQVSFRSAYCDGLETASETEALAYIERFSSHDAVRQKMTQLAALGDDYETAARIRGATR